MSFDEVFRGKAFELRERLRVDRQLLNLLLERRVVSDDQASAVESIVDDCERANELIQILLRADDTRFSLFCKLKPFRLERPSETRKLTNFSTVFELTFSLLHLLQDMGVISSSQASVVEVQLNDDYERAVDELIENLFQADDTRFSLFCDVLYDVNQEDKARWLRTVLSQEVTQTKIRRRPLQQQQQQLQQCTEDESTDDDDDTTDEPKIELKPRAGRSRCCRALKILVLLPALLVMGRVLYLSASTDDDNGNDEIDSRQSNHNTDKSFENFFQGKKADLIKTISVNTLLWSLIEDYDLLIPDEIEECKNRGHTEAVKVRCLLDKLAKRDAKLIPKFCDALRNTRQSHIVEKNFGEDCKM